MEKCQSGFRVNRPNRRFKELLSEHMRKLGAKGGKVGGKRRMETMTDEQRSESAKKAAQARWSAQKP